jgi:outer membrane protein assembly factor BamB
MDLHAVSGKTGQLLWNAESQLVACSLKGGSVGSSAWPPVCVDLTGDGRTTVVVAYEVISGSGEGHQAWMAAMSGKDGKAIWRQPISEKMPMEVNELPSGCTFPFGLADINGDGVRDLVVAVPLRPTKGRPGFGDLWSYELRALSGRDGTLLWRRPLPIQVQSYYIEHAVAAPLIADLAGDGKKQLVTLFRTERLGDQKSGLVWQVQCCNPQTGELLWNWEQADTNFSSSQQDPRLFLAELDGDVRRSVCASIFGAPDVVLDSRGKVRSDVAGTVFASQDIDGDGKEETLIIHERKLRVTRGSATNVLWERADVQGVREILPGKPAATVVVATAQGLLGLDGATGRPLWRAPDNQGEIILADASNRERPRLVTLATDESRATVCRLALPVKPQGTLVVDGPRPEDPRVVRPLPWVGMLVRFIAITDADANQPRANFDVPMTLMIVFSIVVAAQAAYFLYRRRWRGLKVLAAGFMLVTLAIATDAMYVDSQGMNPIEHYSWSGWYLIAVFALPASGLLLVAWRLLVLAARLIRRAVRRVFARPAVA